MGMERKTLLLFSFGLFLLVQAGGICWSQTTERVSVDTSGGNGDNGSNAPSISSDGRYVAFQSAATDLVPTGSNGLVQIFVHDRQTGTTTQVSVNSGGQEGDFPSSAPSISGNGLHVAFESWATNLAAIGDGIFPDIFVHNRQTGETIRVSVNSAGAEGGGPSFHPSISADGRYVAFQSQADNLVVGDTNLFPLSDIFVHDLQTGITTLVSVDSNGVQGNGDSTLPSISADGRYVTFKSQADNLVVGDTNLFPLSDIFVHDLQTGITTLVSVDSNGVQGNGDSTLPSISADGRYVTFKSQADNLVVGDTNLFPLSDIFVHDLQTGTTNLVSVDSNGIQGNGDSSAPSISSDGKFVAFESEADLVADDNGLFSDIFVYERESLPPNVDSTSPADSASGVAVGASITATFSEPMNGSTIDTNTFTLDNGVTGTVIYDANSTTATFTPSSNLNYHTTYTATITTGVQDLAGNPMQADYIWSFTAQSEQKNSGGSGPCFIATASDGGS